MCVELNQEGVHCCIAVYLCDSQHPGGAQCKLKTSLVNCWKQHVTFDASNVDTGARGSEAEQSHMSSATSARTLIISLELHIN